VAAAGVVLVDDEMESRWLATLPVRALWGVGPATEAKLAAIGITQIHHVARMDERILASHLGVAQARLLSSFARGEDERPVENDRATKSIGHEETFAVSVASRDELARHLQRHAAVVARALRSSDVASGTITIKVRFDDGKAVSRSRSVAVALDDEVAIAAVAVDLLQSVPDGPAIRLAGVTASQLRDATGEGQMSFDFAADGVMAMAEEEQRRRGALRSALDEIRSRFGRSAVGTGIEMTGGELDVSRQRGSHAFGPTGETN
jgi:DNA polymerase-4